MNFPRRLSTVHSYSSLDCTAASQSSGRPLIGGGNHEVPAIHRPEVPAIQINPVTVLVNDVEDLVNDVGSGSV